MMSMYWDVLCVWKEDIELLYNLDCVLHMKGDNQDSIWAPPPSGVNIDANSDKNVVVVANWLYFLNKHLAL